MAADPKDVGLFLGRAGAEHAVTRGCHWVHYESYSRSIIGRPWSFSRCACRTYPSLPSIGRSCSTTPASWRTTPRYPHNPRSMCRLPRISAPSSTISWLTRPCCTTASMMETAGAQCLLLAGFFEDQMRRRHNIRWYCRAGRKFFQAGGPSRTLPSRKRGCSTQSRDASSSGVGATRS